MVTRTHSHTPRALCRARWIAALALALLAAASASASPRDDFTRGLEHFSEAQTLAARHPTEPARARDRYRDAAQAFERAWAAGHASPEVACNAANARAFAGDDGEAVLWYRRGLVLSPSHDRLRRGLQAVRSRLTVRRGEATPTEGLVRAVFFWHGRAFTSRRLAFLLLFPVGVVLITRRGVVARALGAALTAAGLALFVSLSISACTSHPEREAVLLLRTEGRAGDGPSYSASHDAPLVPGTELMVLERRGDWLHARLRDGSTTWLPAEVTADVLVSDTP
jgi:hypothetical protein